MIELYESRGEMMIAKIQTSIKRFRKISVDELLKKSFNNFLVILVSAIPIYIAIINKGGCNFFDISCPTKENWTVVIIGALALSGLNYLKEKSIAKKKQEIIVGKKISFDLLEMAIEYIASCNTRSRIEKRNCICEILKVIESSINLVLKELGLTNLENEEKICANIMVKKTNPDRLVLKFFGSRWGGREEMTLQLDENNIMPGAPEAFFYDKVVYINNTMRRKYKHFFNEEKPYRSIISIPIHGKNNNICAILNIDSDEPDKFGSKDIINKKILPTLKPYRSLFKLLDDSLNL